MLEHELEVNALIENIRRMVEQQSGGGYLVKDYAAMLLSGIQDNVRLFLIYEQQLSRTDLILENTSNFEVARKQCSYSSMMDGCFMKGTKG